MPRSALLTLFLCCALTGVAWSQSASEPAEGVNWLAFEDGLQIAGESDRPVLVDIYAPWCGWCSRLQTDVYSEPDVQAYLGNHFTVTRLNIDSIDDVVSFRGYELTSAELAMGLGASGTPTTVFLDASGDYITTTTRICRCRGVSADPDLYRIKGLRLGVVRGFCRDELACSINGRPRLVTLLSDGCDDHTRHSRQISAESNVCQALLACQYRNLRPIVAVHFRHKPSAVHNSLRRTIDQCTIVSKRIQSRIQSLDWLVFNDLLRQSRKLPGRYVRRIGNHDIKPESDSRHRLAFFDIRQEECHRQVESHTVGSCQYQRILTDIARDNPTIRPLRLDGERDAAAASSHIKHPAVRHAFRKSENLVHK